ncbi:MAG: hypothetical protein EOP42_30920 [Sphingobacteriaceae bacterium]|nr:MAG: hypothetical protein EOP42_30920 [Sphingobacteriaceae bacterium]
MYKQTIVPDKDNHSIELPEEFYGKKVDVIVMETEKRNIASIPALPKGKKVSLDQLFETFGTDPDFASIEEICSKAWPFKW